MKTVCITPANLESMALAIWGTNWRKEILVYLGISYSQLHRYMMIYGGQTIPRAVALAMHFAYESVKADKPVPTLPEIPASEAVPVKFAYPKKERVEKVSNEAPEIDIFGEPESNEEEKPETPEPEPEKPETPPAAPEKPKKAPAKKAEPGKPKAPAKPKAMAAKKPAPAKAPEKKKPVRREPVKKA